MLAFLIACVLSQCIHEGGHVLAAKFHHVKIKRVGISKFGPFVEREPGTLGQNIQVSLAGPLANILLALMYSHHHWFYLANMYVGVINLLPIPASDGKRILHCAKELIMKRGSWHERPENDDYSRREPAR